VQITRRDQNNFDSKPGEDYIPCLVVHVSNCFKPSYLKGYNASPSIIPKMSCTIEIRRYDGWEILAKEWAIVIVDQQNAKCYKFERNPETNGALEKSLEADGKESDTFDRTPLGSLSHLEDALDIIRNIQPEEEDLAGYPAGQGWVVLAIWNLANENFIDATVNLSTVLEGLTK